MDKQLEDLEVQVGKRRNFDTPPLDQWHPALSGDIPIRITADGSWYHDGGKIERESLVRLFASILRREADGEYYLVTPAEKWRIDVELHPLIVTDVEYPEKGDSAVLQATLNTGRTINIDKQHPLFLEAAVGDVAALELDHGLTALFSRAAWYRLVEMAEDLDSVMSIKSGNYIFKLSTG